MNIGFISLGCPKNLVDTEIMMDILRKSGHRIVNSPERADAVVINTCGFITDAKEESIETIIEMGKLKDRGIVKYIIATGCLTQRYGQELADEMPELDGVLGISSFKDIAAVLAAVEEGERPMKISDPPLIFMEKGRRMLTTPPGMAYMKIAEGCDNICAYCAIPSIRGRFRSKPIEDIEDEGKLLAKQGIKEVVLIAQDTAAYGRDIYDKPCLPELLNKLERIDGLEWIRVMYLHPAHLNREIIESLAVNSKVIPYLDIPIQHASSRILAMMNRRHDLDYLHSLLANLRQEIDDLVLRTTVMMGFPGEEEQDYKILYDFLAENQFDWLGAFVFTPEEGTRAALMVNQVPREIALERQEQIMCLQKKISRDKNIMRIGRQENILISSQMENNLYLGRGYYQAPDVDGLTIVKTPVKLKKGDFARVHLKAVRNYDLIGEVEE